MVGLIILALLIHVLLKYRVLSRLLYQLMVFKYRIFGERLPVAYVLDKKGIWRVTDHHLGAPFKE